MAVLASDIVTGTYSLLGRPSQNDLPYEDVLEAARDVVRGRTLDLKLAARNHTVQVGSWVTPSDREMSSASFVGGESHFIPVKVEWLSTNEASSSPLPQPRKVTVVSYEAIADLYDKGDYCAFYNGFEHIAFSNSQYELQNRMYRVLYEDTGDVLATKTNSAEFPTLFITLCKYEAALLCLDQIKDDTFAEERERKRGIFTQQFLIWDKRFEKWRTTEFGNKKHTKIGANARWRGRGRI